MWHFTVHDGLESSLRWLLRLRFLQRVLRQELELGWIGRSNLPKERSFSTALAAAAVRILVRHISSFRRGVPHQYLDWDDDARSAYRRYIDNYTSLPSSSPAVATGFEPAELSSYGLANRCLRPLGHTTIGAGNRI